jgi:hypothetical protein
MWIRLLLFLATASLSYGFTNEEAFVILKTELQIAHPLNFYVHHEPVSAPAKPETVVEFQALPQGITAHLSDLDYLPGRRIMSIRYLSDERLKHGNDGAVGLLVLCSTPSDPKAFVPVIATGELDIGTIDDASASKARALSKTRRIIWVSIHYSGTGGFVDRIALTADDVDKPLRAHDIFAKTDSLRRHQETRMGVLAPWQRVQSGDVVWLSSSLLGPEKRTGQRQPLVHDHSLRIPVGSTPPR